MEVYEGGSITELYPYIIDDVKRHGDRVKIDRPDAVDAFTAELHPAIIHVERPGERFISSRPINIAFAMAEVLWIISGRRDVEMLKAYNSTIDQFSDDGVVFNAAYGHRLRSAFGHDQLEDRIRDLQDDRSSRQATLVISNPVDDKGWNRVLADDDDDPTAMIYTKRHTKDRACNVLSHMLIRDNRLDWLQVVRSNDLVWGLPYNWIQFTHLQDYVASRVSADVGTYTHVIHSAHIYSHHFEENISTFDLYKFFPGYEHQPIWWDDEAINVVMREEEVLRTRGYQEVDADSFDIMGGYWSDALSLLAVHLSYANNEDMAAMNALADISDPIIALTALRFYFQKRWGRGDHAVRHTAIDLASDIAAGVNNDGRDAAPLIAWLHEGMPAHV